jgi:hypothetical protein
METPTTDTNPPDQKPPTDKLVNPPKNQTHMVAPQKKGQKSYKLVVMRPFQLGEVEYKDGRVSKDSTRMTKVGEIVEVPRAKAKELCGKINGSYAFSGERYNADKDIPRHDLSLARLATEKDYFEAKPLTPMEDDIFAE